MAPRLSPAQARRLGLALPAATAPEKGAAKSQLESWLAAQIRLLLTGAPEPVREYRFHPHKKWKFDFAWPEVKLAVEIEGGVYVQGRHSRGAGFEADCAKYAEALLLGWRVLRVTRKHLKNGQALRWIEALLYGINP